MAVAGTTNLRRLQGRTLMPGIAAAATVALSLFGLSTLPSAASTVVQPDATLTAGPAATIAGTSIDTNALVCPSPTICLAGASDSSDGAAIVKINGATGAASISGTDNTADFAVNGIACPTSTQCVLVADVGDSATVNGSNGAVGPNNYDSSAGIFDALACPAATSCMAGGSQLSAGPTFTTTLTPMSVNAVAGSTALGQGGQLEGLACVSATRCYGAVAAGGGTGDVLVINNGVVQSAFPTSFDGQAITCDGAASCLMVGEVGETIYSAVVNPTTGKPQARSLIKAMSSVTGATCATATTCFAVGYGIFDSKLFARVSVIENGVPAAATTLAGQSLAAIACPTATTCWATGENPKGTGIVDSVPVPSVPTVTKVTPSTGPTTGGTPITITGTDFVTGATVVVGQGSGTVTGVIPATSVVVMSPTEITAVTGGGAKAGTWSLFVHTTGGTSAGSAGSDFTYKVAAVVPTVSEVSPNTGPTTGGTAITITGTGFVSGATVVIGQGSGSVTGVIPATSVVVVSSTEITAVTGSGAKAGTWSLFVHTTGGTSAGNAGADFVYS